MSGGKDVRRFRPGAHLGGFECALSGDAEGRGSCSPTGSTGGRREIDTSVTLITKYSNLIFVIYCI